MDWVLFIELLSRILPIVITLFSIAVITILVIGLPYCQYIHYLSLSNTEEGQESLAKYLAKKAGGRGINVDSHWQSFVPAAKDLRQCHLSRKQENSK